MPAPEALGAAGVFWAYRNPDLDVRYGSAGLLSLADLTVDPPNQDVAYVAGTIRTVAQVIYGNQNWSTTIVGGEVDWPLIRSWNVAQGQFSRR